MILATVPKSFVGQSFASFRSRMEEQARLAIEEEQRKEKEEGEMRQWLQEQIQICEAIANDPTKPQQERDIAEQRLRGFANWSV